MDLDADRPELDEMREFKVHLPMQLHVRLHSERLLQGTTLSGSVQNALEAYFERHLPT